MNRECTLHSLKHASLRKGSTILTNFAKHYRMVNFVSIASAAVLLIITIFYFWRKNQKNYRLPPGPTQSLIFGNLMELIYSTLIKSEPPFIKLAQWSFQVNKKRAFQIKKNTILKNENFLIFRRDRYATCGFIDNESS
jgi:hypothetical protein